MRLRTTLLLAVIAAAAATATSVAGAAPREFTKKFPPRPGQFTIEQLGAVTGELQIDGSYPIN